MCGHQTSLEVMTVVHVALLAALRRLPTAPKRQTAGSLAWRSHSAWTHRAQCTWRPSEQGIGKPTDRHRCPDRKATAGQFSSQGTERCNVRKERRDESAATRRGPEWQLLGSQADAGNVSDGSTAAICASKGRCKKRPFPRRGSLNDFVYKSAIGSGPSPGYRSAW